MVFDSKAHIYFEKESLEIILFDDNATISGKELNVKGEPVDDKIGIARVPSRFFLRATQSTINLHFAA